MVCMTLSLLCLLENSQKSHLFGNQETFIAVLPLLLDERFWQVKWHLGNSCFWPPKALLPKPAVHHTFLRAYPGLWPEDSGPEILVCTTWIWIGSAAQEERFFPFWESLIPWTFQLMDDIFCLILSMSPITPFPTSSSHARFYVKYILSWVGIWYL